MLNFIKLAGERIKSTLEETIDKIGDKKDEIKEAINTTAEKVVTSLRTGREKALNTISNIADKIKEKIEDNKENKENQENQENNNFNELYDFNDFDFNGKDEEEEEDEEDNSLIEKNESTIISLQEIKTDEKDNELDSKLTLKNVREIENKIETRSNANRTYTLNAKQKINELGGLSPTRRNRRKRTNNNEGLNIFDVWKDIRQEMNEKKKKSRFHQ
jgi:hypothetical protein